MARMLRCLKRRRVTAANGTAKLFFCLLLLLATLSCDLLSNQFPDSETGKSDNNGKSDKIGNLIVFGDELSDQGNFLYLARKFERVSVEYRLPSPPAGYDGMAMTNKKVMLDYFAAMRGIELLPAWRDDVEILPIQGKGYNFAVSGSWIAELGSRQDEYFYSPTLEEQIDKFSKSNFPVSDDTVFVIFIGFNDVDEFSRGVVSEKDVDVLAAKFAAATNKLVQLGASKIVVLGIPNLEEFPLFYGRTAAAQVSKIVRNLNSALESKLQPVGEVLFLPIYDWMTDYLNNWPVPELSHSYCLTHEEPENSFGKISLPYVNGCDFEQLDADYRYPFFDGRHPASGFAKDFAVFLASQIKF